MRTINSFTRLTANEFLRFNDLKPGTPRQPFWFFISWLVLIWTFLSLIRWWFGEANSELSQIAMVFSGAVFAFFIIPVSALYVRRLSDSIGLGPVVATILKWERQGVWGKIGRLFIGAFFALLLAFFWSFAWIVTLAVLATAALVPSKTVAKLRSTANAQAPSGFAVPPTLKAPPSLDLPATPIRPPQDPLASQIINAFVSSQPTPSKQLLQRVGFWISVLLFLLALLIPFQDQAQTLIDNTFPSSTTEPQPVVADLETTPPVTTPGESPVLLPAPSEPVAEPAVTQSVSGDLTSRVDQDNGGVVAVVPSGDDEVSLDPRFRYCTHAIGAGFGPYYYGLDPEYEWYNDRDRDGIVCER